MKNASSFDARVPPPPKVPPPLLLLLALPCVAEVELIGWEGGGTVGGELLWEENRAAEEEAKFAARVWDREKRVVVAVVEGGLATRVCKEAKAASWWGEEGSPSSSTPRGRAVAVDGVMRRELL